jgi:hypothetical protein
MLAERQKRAFGEFQKRRAMRQFQRTALAFSGLSTSAGLLNEAVEFTVSRSAEECFELGRSVN